MNATPLPPPTASEHLFALALRVDGFPLSGLPRSIARHVATSLRTFADELARPWSLERWRLARDLKLAAEVFAFSPVPGVAEVWREAAQAVEDELERTTRPTQPKIGGVQ